MTERWRKKDEQGDDLITFWKRFPAHSNEAAATEIIEQLERELAEAKHDAAEWMSIALMERREAAEARNAALEEAARVCDRQAAMHRRESASNPIIFNAHAEEAEYLARHIRALKNAAPQVGIPDSSDGTRKKPAGDALPIMSRSRLLVEAQAKDRGLWFDANRASEAYLQRSLRALHAAVEADTQSARGENGA